MHLGILLHLKMPSDIIALYLTALSGTPNRWHDSIFYHQKIAILNFIKH